MTYEDYGNRYITQIHTIKGPNAEKRVNEWLKGEDVIDIKTTLVDRDIWYTIIYRRRVKK